MKAVVTEGGGDGGGGDVGGEGGGEGGGDMLELQNTVGNFDHWIPKILDRGMNPLAEFYENWAPDKFRTVIENKLQELV